MAMGLEQAGFEHVLLVEMNAMCVQSLRRNGFKHVKHSNAKFVDYTQYLGADLVAGGPPCQPFSVAGAGGGETDSRDGWPIAVRAVKEVQPRAFFFENVAGILREQFQEYFERVLKQFWDLGYSVHVRSVDAAAYGVPQHRKRVFLVGIRGVAWFQPPPTVEQQVTVRDMMVALGPPTGRDGHEHHGASPRQYKGHTGSIMDAPSKCLTAATHGQAGGAGLVQLDNGELRYFTLREMACLQTFPLTYKLPPVWSHAVFQLGNACPTMLAKKFGEALLAHMNALPPSKASRTAGHPSKDCDCVDI